MTNKELYEHKETYEEMLSLLKKYEDLPNINHAIWEVERCTRECRRYERWKINKREWDCHYDDDLPCDAFLQECEYIPNQENERLHLSSPTTYFVLYFSTGPYIFGNDYPEALFTEFYEELKHTTKPKYADDVNNKLYYTEETASKAYEVVQELYQKYQARYVPESKARRIQALQEELTELLKKGKEASNEN